jgi:hypothetical protein
MKNHEVNKIIREFDGKFFSSLTPREKTVVALYHGSYDQKSYIFLEDSLDYVSSDALLVYGIVPPDASPGKILKRKYILFVEDSGVFQTPEELRKFYDEYCERFLPEGQVPDEFALKFDVFSHEEYKHYFSMLAEVCGSIQPFYTFRSAIVKGTSNDKLTDVNSLFSGVYDVVVYDEVLHNSLLSFFSNSSIKEEDFKEEFLRSIEDFANRISVSTHPPVVYASFFPTDVDEFNKVSLVLAYLNYRWGIAIYCDSSMQNYIINMLAKFYFPVEICTLYDKLAILKGYPNVCFLRKEFCEYMVYVPDEGRTVVGSISFLDRNVLTVDKNLLNMVIVEEYDSEWFEEELKALEAAMKFDVFLHVGNTVCADLEGLGRKVVFVDNLSVNFPGVVIPLDPMFVTFQSPIDLEVLSRAIPIVSCFFHKIGERPSVENIFKERLGRIRQEGLIKIPQRLKTIPFVPELFKDGEAVVHYSLYNFLKDKYPFKDKNSKISKLCSYQNVVFRNQLVHELMETVSLNVLRGLPYLTVWGTDLSSLSIDETMFKTKL